MRLCPDTFGRVIDAIVRLWGLLVIELSPEAGVYAEKVYRASLGWVPLPVLVGLAAAVGLTRERLAASPSPGKERIDLVAVVQRHILIVAISRTGRSRRRA